VVPEAGVDRVAWAKQLVGNAVRSPHTRQAYEYALEQFFHWAAERTCYLFLRYNPRIRNVGLFPSPLLNFFRT
jgi:hypothetical protein